MSCLLNLGITQGPTDEIKTHPNKKGSYLRVDWLDEVLAKRQKAAA